MSTRTDETPGTSLTTVLRETLILFRPERRLLAFVLLVNLVGSLLTGVGDPLSLKLMIDSLARKDLTGFLWLAGLVMLIYAAFRGASYVSSLSSQQLRHRLCAHLTLRLTRAFYQLPYSKVRDSESGYFISRLYDEPARVTLAVNLLVDLFSSITVCLCALAVCLFLSWKIALLVFLVVPFLFFLSVRYGTQIRRISLQETEAEARWRGGLGRAIRSYKTVRVFDLHGKVLQDLEKLLQRFLNAGYERTKQGAAFTTWSGTALSSMETLIMVVAGIQVLRGEISLGGLFGFVSAYWRVVNSFQNLASRVPAMAQLGAQLTRIKELEAGLGLPPCPNLAPDRGEWELRDLSIHFGERPLLTGFNLRWKDGDKLLIVGPNGSGKSTLAHLIVGLFEDCRGELQVPGLARTSALLSPFGFIPGTLRDNLWHASAEETLPSTLELARLLGLEDKLDRDPEGFSEGEKKKSQILMTLAKKASLYILDEPLANIDSESKSWLMALIFSLTGNSSLILILHGDDQFRHHFDHVVDLGREHASHRECQAS